MPAPHNPARLERLLAACRKGLNHDLPNQLIALAGLLQLFEADEAARLSDDGRDYLRRISHTLQRTLALTRMLKELLRLCGDPPAAEIVALPELAGEVLAEWQPAPVCRFAWLAPRIVAPRSLLQLALAQALRLLFDHAGSVAKTADFHSQSSQGRIELTVGSALSALSPSTALPAPSLVEMPAAWHDRPECVLIRELADACGGAVRWQKVGEALQVTFTLAAPQGVLAHE